MFNLAQLNRLLRDYCCDHVAPNETGYCLDYLTDDGQNEELTIRCIIEYMGSQLKINATAEGTFVEHIHTGVKPTAFHFEFLQGAVEIIDGAIKECLDDCITSHE